MVIVLPRPGRAAAVLIFGTAGDFKDSAPIALYGYLYFSILNGDGWAILQEIHSLPGGAGKRNRDGELGGMASFSPSAREMAGRRASSLVRLRTPSSPHSPP